MTQSTTLALHERHRRLLLATLLAGGGSAILGGCASTPRAPPLPPQPIRTLAVLPLVVAAEGESTGFGVRHVPIYVGGSYGTSRGSSSSSSSAAAAIGAGLLAAAIVYGIAENRRREREAVLDAMAQVAFDPLAYADQRLTTALAQRQVQVLRIADAQAAAQIRGNSPGGMPAGVDAVLEVTVEQSGYYSSSRAGGYSPMLQLTATLRSAAPGAKELESFAYYADWRDGGADRRWITTPRAMTYGTLDLLKSDAAAVRAALEQLVERFVAMIADDVQRHAAGQLRVD